MSLQILSRGHDSEGQPFGMREVYIAGTRCLDNGRVVIGSALALQPKFPTATQDGETLQAALLEPRTARPRPALLHLASNFWRWC